MYRIRYELGPTQRVRMPASIMNPDQLNEFGFLNAQ
ncbi:hypothetical protein F383_29753 [Gossypium arboreum]|uniref:Uncharacterized protein n=1 Tax=Gossypium arboreum TaxID=29729 RepID=A0A0B0PDM8_GOSAR|nr:hypothetical protein F383_29753 [Gossypium arboreum]